MTAATVSIDGDAFRKGLQALGEDIGRAIVGTLNAVAAAAAQEARQTQLFKDRTGNLRGSIEWIPAGSEVGLNFRSRVRAGKDAKYAKFVHDGTRAHPIVARRARMLTFMMGGVRVFRHSVKHPGTSPRPFLTKAGEFAENSIAHSEGQRRIDLAVTKHDGR